MANFDTAITRHESVKSANNLIEHIRALYASGKQIQSLLSLYQAGSDPVFNAAINALFTSAERTELAAMLTQVNTLVSDWESNHGGAIGIV